MDVNRPEEEWIEEEWDDDDWVNDESIAHAAGQIADAAQLCISQPDGLHKAFHNTLNSIKLFAFSALVKNSRLEEQSEARVSQMAGVIPEDVGNFAQQLISDPQSKSHQSAIKNVTDYLALHDVSSDNLSRPSGEVDKIPSKILKLVECSESVISTLYNTFYTNSYLPCIRSAECIAACPSDQYVCSLRLDGNHTVLGDDDHFFFDSVFAGKNDGSSQWTPIQFQLPRLVGARTGYVNCD